MENIFKPEHFLIAELRHSINEGKWLLKELDLVRNRVGVIQSRSQTVTSISTHFPSFIQPGINILTNAAAHSISNIAMVNCGARYDFLKGRKELAEKRVMNLCEKIYDINPNSLPKIYAFRKQEMQALTNEPHANKDLHDSEVISQHTATASYDPTPSATNIDNETQTLISKIDETKFELAFRINSACGLLALISPEDVPHDDE